MHEPQSVKGDPLLTLRTLGSIGVYLGGRREPLLGPGKPVALLTYLEALPHHRASREHLLDLLWSDIDPVAARHALRQMTLYLRQRLGRPVVSVGNGELELAVPLESDRARFLAAVESGRLADAVEIYRGEFLPGFAVPGGTGFEHWADAERRRFQLLFQRAAESLSHTELKQGHFRRARELARRVRDADSLAENGWRLLIEACLAHGDRVSALAEAQRLEELLAAERRVPQLATRAILRHVRSEPDVPGEPQERTLAAELVGREREFAALATAAERARRGTGQVASIIAPAGLGKTRLLRDLAHRLAAAGSTAVYVRAHPGDRDLPWSYVAQIVRELAQRPGARAVSPATASGLVAIEPSLSSLFPTPPDPSIGDEARRRRVAAVAELIQTVSEERPLALLLDDLHWADAASRDAVKRIATRLRGARVLFALAARPSGVLQQVDIDETVTLTPLTTAQVEALVASLGTLPDDRWSKAFAERLNTAARGSPLLVLETLQLAIESGSLSLTHDRWSCSDESVLRTLFAAGSALARRIAQLDRSQGWLLLLLAVHGAPVGTDSIVHAAGPNPDLAPADLVALEHRGLIARVRDLWTVAHDEIAAHAEQNATTDQVRAAHAALGRALLATSPEPVNLRLAAKHLAAASLDEELVSLVRNWVRRARARGDRSEAGSLVAELLGTPVDDVRLQRLVTTLPLRVRFPRAPLVAAAAWVGALFAITAIAALPRRAPNDAGVTIGAWVPDSAGRGRLYTRRLTGHDVAAGEIRLESLQPTAVSNLGFPDGVMRPSTTNTWAFTRTYPDSGGVEVVLFNSREGKLTRLTYQPGDDWTGTWSPDGRYLAIATDRWSDRSHSSLAIIDPQHPDSVLVRLTGSPLTRDVFPSWSPDGSRIAFIREHFHHAPSRHETCLVSADARGERCLHLPGFVGSGPILGWASPFQLVSVFADSSGVTRILVVQTETGKYHELAEGQGIGASLAVGWIACLCRRNVGEPYQALVIPVGDPSRAVRLTPGDPPPVLTLLPSAANGHYLERFEIVPVTRPIPVDGAYQLRVRAWDARDHPTEPTAVRWSSSDSTVARVGADGALHPRRVGEVVVRATSGGWRTDSLHVAIEPGETRRALVEDWRDGIAPRWVPFGTPPPFIVQSEQGLALAPNGDSTFVSGVYTRGRLPTREGVGVEFYLSAPITDRQWQSLDVRLQSMDSLDPRAWDHEVGHLPVSQESWRSCAFAYPMGGVREHMSLQAGLARTLQAPAGMADGDWVRVRLQFFPDGRCGLAVNGEASAIVERQVPLGDSAFLLIRSYSHRTRILVGRIEAWLGVRRDVDWRTVERR